MYYSNLARIKLIEFSFPYKPNPKYGRRKEKKPETSKRKRMKHFNAKNPEIIQSMLKTKHFTFIIGKNSAARMLKSMLKSY